MKRILVLSDIHIPARLNKFPNHAIEPYLKAVDIVFGLGDYNSQDGLNILYGFGKELYAVNGNMDDDQIKFNLPALLNINIEGINIGLIHGWGGHYGIREKIAKQFDNVKLICYGHTHSPYFGENGLISFFNPGSICGNNPSFGILTLNNKKIEAKIIYI